MEDDHGFPLLLLPIILREIECFSLRFARSDGRSLCNGLSRNQQHHVSSYSLPGRLAYGIFWWRRIYFRKHRFGYRYWRLWVDNHLEQRNHQSDRDRTYDL